MPAQPEQDIFVGREREMAELTAALEDALAGRGRLVMLVGEPGIGKTRTCQEVAANAQSRGALALWGRCYEGEGAPPYWPWAQVLRACIEMCDAERLRSAAGAGAADIGLIVPELQHKLATLAPRPEDAEQAVTGHAPGTLDKQSLDPESDRFRIFDFVAAFLRNLSLDQPLVIILDNLHRADRPSLLLLEFLAQQMAKARILVLGTYRDTEVSHEHALLRTLGELAREPSFHQVSLRGLPTEKTGEFIRAVSNMQPTDELVLAVHSRTDGNPLFMTHVARLLSFEADCSPAQDWTTAIPDSVRIAIKRRFDRLPECGEALTVGAVIGREFGLDQLEQVLGKGPGVSLLEALERALPAGIIEEVLGVPGRYRFTHALIQDTLAQGLSAARRARLHAHIGQVLEALYGPAADAHADELAFHYLQGGSTEKAAYFAIKAGDRSLTVYAWEQAITYFQTASELMTKMKAGPRERADVLVKVAMATTSARGHDAPHHLEKALVLYEAAGDQRKAAEVRFSLSQRVNVFAMGPDAWEKAYSHALKAVEFLEQGHRGPLLARTYARLGDIAVHVGTRPISIAVHVGEQALAMAKELEDVTALREAAMALGHTLVFHVGEIERGLKVGREACDAARIRGDALGLCESATFQAFSHLVLMDPDEALRWAEEATAASEQSGAPVYQMWAYLALVWALALSGDTRRAILNLDRVMDLSRRRGVEFKTLRTAAFGAPGLVYFLAGEWEKAESELRQRMEFADRISLMPVFQILAREPLARLLLERGDLQGAMAHLEKAVAVSSPLRADAQGFDVSKALGLSDLASVEPKGEITLELGVRCLLVEAAARSGDVGKAAVHLRRCKDVLSNGQDWRGLAAGVRLAEAFLATAEERWEEAEAAFQAAADINRRLRLPYFEARSLMALGQMCLSRNSAGDKTRALEHLDQAYAIFQRISARRMAEKVVALKERSTPGARPSSSYPNGLTARQAEVLRLIAEGRSNREIAAGLVLSQRTVQRHVADIYAKIGARNRAEATAFALKKLGPLPQPARA
jgi:DNA-binding CsgD family transcriptional regulator